MKLLPVIAFVLQGPQRTSPVEDDRNAEAASKQFGNEYGSIQYQRRGSTRSQPRMTAIWNTSSMRTTAAPKYLGAAAVGLGPLIKEAVD